MGKETRLDRFEDVGPNSSVSLDFSIGGGAINENDSGHTECFFRFLSIFCGTFPPS